MQKSTVIAALLVVVAGFAWVDEGTGSPRFLDVVEPGLSRLGEE